MTVSTLRPNSTSLNDGILTGGATAHAVLSDDSDASYDTLFSGGENLRVGLGDLTLPADVAMPPGRLRRIPRSQPNKPGGIFCQVEIDGGSTWRRAELATGHGAPLNRAARRAAGTRG